MGRIPRLVAMADAIGMTNLSRALVVAGPVITGSILAVGKGSTIRSRTRQHIVQVGHRITDTVYFVTFLRERKRFKHVGATLSFNQRVTVNFRLDYWSTKSSPRVVPGPISDPIVLVRPAYSRLTYQLDTDTRPALRPLYNSCTDTNGPAPKVHMDERGILNELLPGDPLYWDATDPRPWATWLNESDARFKTYRESLATGSREN